MDKINVTTEALRNVYITLQRFQETSDAITNKCEQELLSQISSLDSTFRKDIQKYINNINELNQKVKYFVDENSTAISDRLNKIPDYENKTYVKHNII